MKCCVSQRLALALTQPLVSLLALQALPTGLRDSGRVSEEAGVGEVGERCGRPGDLGEGGGGYEKGRSAHHDLHEFLMLLDYLTRWRGTLLTLTPLSSYSIKLLIIFIITRNSL